MRHIGGRKKPKEYTQQELRPVASIDQFLQFVRPNAPASTLNEIELQKVASHTITRYIRECRRRLACTVHYAVCTFTITKVCDEEKCMGRVQGQKEICYQHNEKHPRLIKVIDVDNVC